MKQTEARASEGMQVGIFKEVGKNDLRTSKSMALSQPEGTP